ncbi:MAG: Asparagine synthetase [glutamine-hydrolyzing] 1 [Candidatus Omnitrophica bacterium]|nr:Asparagine synthetase [glutamine-hydrolyzing] 1 [Candidatus Omnitrophota bacterium]
MCAVCGVYWGDAPAPPGAAQTVRAMLARLRHRGPDGSAVAASSAGALGHARLRLVGGPLDAQPLIDDARGLVMSCAGEIYGAGRLRTRMKAEGQEFATGSDCELLLAAYRSSGLDGLRRLDGQWAAALLDSRNGSLVLCRDRFGIAPLYYARLGGAWYFASEIKALYAVAEFTPSPDPAAVRDWMRCWSPLPGRTFFSGVSEVPPGCAVVIRGPDAQQVRWWHPEVRTYSGGAADAAVQLRERLDAAVRSRACETDERVGVYLSGGLDSSIVAASTVRARPDAELLHVDVPGSGEERRHAEAVAERLGRPLRVAGWDPARAIDELESVVRQAEQPFLRSGPLALHALARTAGQTGVKAVLTGEGADELCFGYDLYLETALRWSCAGRSQRSKRRRLLSRVHPDVGGQDRASAYWVESFFAEGSKPADADFSHAVRWSRMDVLSRQLADRWTSADRSREAFVEDLRRALPAGWDQGDPLERARSLELNLLLPQFLLSAQGERMTLTWGIEARQPFLQHELVEWILGLPRPLLLRGLRTKRLLRQAYADELPPEVVRRRKQPFAAPHLGAHPAAWEPLERWAAEADRSEEGLLRPGSLGFLVQKCRRTRGKLTESEGMLLNAAVSWEVFRRVFLSRAAKGAAV